MTASWAVPFPVRFRKEAAALKAGVAEELIEIANHGWTQCVLQENLFKPRWFEVNRTFHREF